MITASVDGENDGKWWQMPEDGTGSREQPDLCSGRGSGKRGLVRNSGLMWPGDTKVLSSDPSYVDHDMFF